MIAFDVSVILLSLLSLNVKSSQRKSTATVSISEEQLTAAVGAPRQTNGSTRPRLVRNLRGSLVETRKMKMKIRKIE